MDGMFGKKPHTFYHYPHKEIITITTDYVYISVFTKYYIYNFQYLDCSSHYKIEK